MQFALALDLKNDPASIAEYENWHRQVWPEIIASIRDSGIVSLKIWRVADRLFMLIEADEHFSFEKKSASDAANPMVQKWEELMWNFQQSLPFAKPGEKWVLMEKIFDLNDATT